MPKCIGYKRSEQFKHASGAGADIEQITRREPADNVDEHCLDFGLIDVERPYPVPVRRVVTEIRGGQFRAMALDRRKPLQIERDRLIVLATGIHQIATEKADSPARTEPIKHPTPLPSTVE